jgi:hypothetical protein
VPVRLAGEVRGEELALQLETDDIPLATLPLPLEEPAPVGNPVGTLQVRMTIDGFVYDPVVSGVATLAEAGFDFREVQVRNLEGQADFDRQTVRLNTIRGRAGNCDFEVSGEFAVARWRETLATHLVAPGCELDELLRLAERGGVGTPPMLQAEVLQGTGALTIDYGNQQWRAELEVDTGRWSPDWLALPLTDINARIGVDPTGLELHHLIGQVGSSPALLYGRMGAPASSPSSWKLELATQLESQDAERLLHHRGPEWLSLPGPITGSARLVGSPEEEIKIEAKLHPLSRANDANDTNENPTDAAEQNPPDSPGSLPLIEVAGLWDGNVFALERFTANLGSVVVEGRGRARFSPQRYYDLGFTLPPGSSLPDLLAFVRLPEGFGSLEGTVAAEVALEGPAEDLDWKGTITLEEVHVPDLLTEPVSLKGPLELSKEGLHLRDIEVAQPQGTFTLSGVVRPDDVSDLRLTGAWANLDRLLGELPEAKPSVSRSHFLARHPFRVRIELDQVQFLGVVLTQVQGELEQAGGLLALRIPQFGLGPGRGDAVFRPDPARDRVRARVELEEVPAETLLVDLLEQAPTVRAPLSLQAQLSGPLGTQEEFLRGADGQIRFALGEGRIQRGTLPERLFALAVLLREGFYGFGLFRLGRSLTKPRGLRRFQEWTGTIRFDEGTAHIETYLVANVYDVNMTGEVELESGAIQIHGEGDFHPGWEFDISLKNIVNLFAQLFRRARGKKGHKFEFDVGGKIGGRKSVENFRFKD